VYEENPVYRKIKSVITEKKGRSSYIGEDDFVSLVKDGIAINFHIKNPNLYMVNILRVVKRAQKIVKDRFDHTLTSIDIDIYDSIEEMREEGKSKSRYASWIAGIYDGKIRVISENEDEPPPALYIILTHEIIHLAVDEMSRGLCPYWLDEGLAVCLSQEIPDEYEKRLGEAIKKDKTLPLEILEKPLPSDTPELLRQTAYAEVFSITEFLIESLGWDKIRSIVHQCQRRPPRIIFTDLGLNYYLLENGWKKWAAGKMDKINL